MAKRQISKTKGKALPNQRRTRISFAEALSGANQRAHEQANRRSGRRELKSIWASVAAVDMEHEDDGTVDFAKRMMRWLLAILILPMCWVTTWTFLSRFSDATLERGFWQSREFWYFAIGALSMGGWFISGIGKSFFLYLYVLGHELTHAVFVWAFRGKVTDFHVSVNGGYITTNKTNFMIALSPYFVPLWAVVIAILYGVLRISTELKPGWDLAFYFLMGGMWTFHMVWTLWMLPRDQPDLKENGTLLSLVIIYLANLLVLVLLLCVADESPLSNAREFAYEWLKNAAIWADVVWRWSLYMISELRTFGKF